MKVTGNTTIFGVIGNPVRHSYSPIMHNAAYEALGLNCIYIPMEVEPTRLQSAIKGLTALGIRGVNITIPYKEDVVPFMDALSPEATTIGSVNTISISDKGKLTGHATDGDGFISALQEDLQFTCNQKRICILGTGGSSRAVALYSAMHHAHKITIVGRKLEKAERLVERIQELYPKTISKALTLNDPAFKAIIESSDLLVNATPNGMKPDDPILIPLDWFQPKLKVLDLIYNPFETKLIQAAKMQGCQAVNGLGMLIHQGSLAFAIWLGIQPPIQTFRESILDYLKKRQSIEGGK